MKCGFSFIFVCIKELALKNFVVPILLFTSLLVAQDDKTLFWEISGNGLSKKSYLYGTMHVNDKISYHLSDAFFANLMAADIVGTESDPETWDEITSMMNAVPLPAPYLFYTSFYMNPIEKNQVKKVFANHSNYFSQLFAGRESAQSDFQENNVLDMFIYQTGRKYKKRIVGLEDAKGSVISLMNIGNDQAIPDEKNRIALMKLIKSGNIDETLRDYYREKDIVMMDSINKLMMSKKTFDAVITNRNIVMAHSIDSIAKTGSLFSAVGAAHLAGKKGIIALLQEKGYTVTPVFGTMTEAGQTQKKAIEDYFPDPGFQMAGSTDGMIRMPMTGKVIRESEDIGSPDLTNGGAITIKRLPLNYFLHKKETTFNPKTLDSLFFENIAGEILEKKYFEETNFVGYDVRNVTKIGNSQHWRFYITPLELIAISMTGSGNYTKQFEKEVFDGIQIKPFSNTWETFTAKKGGIAVSLPAFHTVYGDSASGLRNIEIQAFDPSEKAHYFLTERTLNNTSLLEDTEFELEQIHYEFYLQHDTGSTKGHMDYDKNEFVSEGQIGTKRLRLKSVIHGNKYYLLGTVDASTINSDRFFDSFAPQPFNYTSAAKTFTDSVGQYQIDIPEKPNELLFLNRHTPPSKNKNIFESKNKQHIFNSESGKTVQLSYYLHHKYEFIPAIDSLKQQFRKDFLMDGGTSSSAYDDTDYTYDYDDNSSGTALYNAALCSKKGFSKSLWPVLINNQQEEYQIMTESYAFDKNKDVHVFNALVSKVGSNQAIKHKILFNGSAYIQLSALVEKDYQNNDPFVEKAFNSLAFTNSGKNSVPTNKLASFITDAQSKNDTIRFSAMESVSLVTVGKDDFKTLTSFVDSFEFKSNETYALASLINKIGSLEDERALSYLANKYKKEGTTTFLQLSILNALSKQQSKSAYKKILELLDYDLPISDSPQDIEFLFSNFKKDLGNSKELFPKIFQYYSIKEYNEPILDFCITLLDAGMVKGQKLNSFKKILFTNAKLEYKRILSWKEKNPDQVEQQPDSENTDAENTEEEVVVMEDSVSTTYNEAVEILVDVDRGSVPTKELLYYMNLISHFPSDENGRELFAKIKALNIPSLNLEWLRLGMLNNTITEGEIKSALKNPETTYATIQLLLHENNENLVNALSDEAIAMAAVTNFEGLETRDKAILVHTKKVKHQGKDIHYYFYQMDNRAYEYDLPSKSLYAIAFVTENNRINPLAYKIVSKTKIDDSEDVRKKCEQLITASLNEDRFRASFEKQQKEEEYSRYGMY